MAFWQEFFCVIRGLHKVLSVNVPITQISCFGIDFPITHTCVTQKRCFRIICVLIAGLIVVFLIQRGPQPVECYTISASPP